MVLDLHIFDFANRLKSSVSKILDAFQPIYFKRKEKKNSTVFLNITSWGEFYISVVQGTCFWLTNTFLEQFALCESGSRNKKQSDQQEEQMLQM